jgi:glycosyltransferase involved in cell wall biosynthesis
MGKRCFIVIPAHNEESMIAEVVNDLRKHRYNNIVVVDDGSSDNTFEVAEKLGVQVLRHVINRGQGAALRTGIEFCLDAGADIIVTFDADGQHQAKEIGKMIAPIADDEVDVTLGSRFLRKSDIPALRRIYLRVGALVIHIMYGIRLTDSHNGFRALSRLAAKRIEIKSNGMEHASEIPEQIMRNKLRFKEVPVDIRYTEYSVKHGQDFTTNAFKIFFRMILRKLMG